MKKIMFNDKYGLTEAVLEGRKTQTRRIINIPDGETLEPFYIKDSILTSVHLVSNHNFILNPAYMVGEEVAIAQSYRDANVTSETVTLNGITETFYLGDWMPGWHNKLFVRSDLMPHSIKITNIRIEHLQDISEEDCLKEGIVCKNERYVVETYKGVEFYTKDANLAFKYLIDKICGRGTWHSNPYVFVYDFQLIK